MSSLPDDHSLMKNESDVKPGRFRPLRVKGKKVEIFHLLQEHLIFDVAHLVLEYVAPLVDHKEIPQQPKPTNGIYLDGSYNPDQICLAWDAEVQRDRLLVSYPGLGGIKMFETDGTFVREYYVTFNDYRSSFSPHGIAFDPVSQCIFVCDTGVHCVRVVKLSDGVIVRSIGDVAHSDESKKASKNPRGIALNVAKRLVYVSDFWGHHISVYTTDGLFVRKFGTYGVRPGQFREPRGLVVDETTGELYVADAYNARIQVFSGQGDFIRIIGNGPGRDNGQFECPAAVAVDVCNNLLLACDGGGHRVQIMSLDKSEYISQLGSGTRRGDAFVVDTPNGVAFDPYSLKVYVSDSMRHSTFVFSLQE